MIKNTILPERIGTYYLFAKRVIGFDINRTHVNATKVLLKGNQVVIEQCIEEKLDTSSMEHEERVAHAIKNVVNHMHKYQEIRTAISSSVVIFKELHMPFSNHEQIRMAVPFEVDPLLPFSVHDAVVDFIITKVNEDKSAQVLVAAVQNHYIAEHLQPFEMAGINADVITVDLFALYGLYKRVPAYQSMIDNVALIDLGSQGTGIGYIKDHKLGYIRSLPKGVSSIAKSVGKELNRQPGQAIGEIIRFGIQKEDDPQYTKAVAHAVKEFWKDIQFTLSSFQSNEPRIKAQVPPAPEAPQKKEAPAQEQKSTKETAPSAEEKKQIEQVPQESKENKDEQKAVEPTHKSQPDPSHDHTQLMPMPQEKPLEKEQGPQQHKVILLGIATDIKGLPEFLHKEVGVECEIFDVSSLDTDANVKIKVQQPIKSTQIMSVSVAMPSQETEYFNLRQKEFAPKTTSLLLKQLIVGGVLLATLFGSLAGFMFLQVHSLKSEANQLEEDTITEIKERFKKIPEDEVVLDDVINKAKKETENQEKLLSAFLRSARPSVLMYLLELTKRLNPQALGLQVDQIVIKEDTMKFKARVRDYEALKILEYDLSQSPLFKRIPPQEEPSFTMEIALTKGKFHGNTQKV